MSQTAGTRSAAQPKPTSYSVSCVHSMIWYYVRPYCCVSQSGGLETPVWLISYIRSIDSYRYLYSMRIVLVIMPNLSILPTAVKRYYHVIILYVYHLPGPSHSATTTDDPRWTSSTFHSCQEKTCTWYIYTSTSIRSINKYIPVLRNINISYYVALFFTSYHSIDIVIVVHEGTSKHLLGV